MRPLGLVAAAGIFVGSGNWAGNSRAADPGGEESGGIFIRGNSNDDVAFTADISDAIYTLTFLFVGGKAPPCMDAADVNDDGKVDISDPISLLGWLFLGGEKLKPPSPAARGERPAPGTDPTPDLLDCAGGDRDGDGLGDSDEISTHGSGFRDADTDGDELPDGDEVKVHGTSPISEDSDDDGLKDGEELVPGDDGHVTSPTKADSDDDGLMDGQEMLFGSSPLDADADGDGIPDGEEKARGTRPGARDSDGDGLSDGEEVHPAGSRPATDPLKPDTDGDGLSDGQEAPSGMPEPITDPLNADTDGDGIRDGAERSWGADFDSDGLASARDPDSDGDGLPDPDEDSNFNGVLDPGETNPASADTDQDGLSDPWEREFVLDPRAHSSSEDPDEDGLTNAREWARGSNPRKADTDGDGVADGIEADGGTSVVEADSDGDRLQDGAEVAAGSNPLDPDTDGDEIPDGAERSWNVDTDRDGYVNAADTDSDGDALADDTEDADIDGTVDPGETDPATADTDGDGAPDGWERSHGFDPLFPADGSWDPDADGATNAQEAGSGSDPGDSDSDGDGIPDGLEISLHLDPLSPSGASDLDGDGAGNLAEYRQGTALDDPDSDRDGLADGAEATAGCDPKNPDTDSDGYLDGDETRIGTNPLAGDTDGDEIVDGEEAVEGSDGFITNPLEADTDADGIPDAEEIAPGADLRTSDPTSADTDGDGIPDGAEVVTHGTDPSEADTDGDGADDGVELGLETDPLDPDTDGDGLKDGEEVAARTNPLLADTDRDGVEDGEDLDPLDDDADGDRLLDGEEAMAGAIWLEAEDEELLFVRGDVNGDGSVTDADLTRLRDSIFSGPPIACPDVPDAADVDDSGAVDSTDVIQLAQLLADEVDLPEPFPEPGFDPTPDGLPSCARDDSKARNGYCAGHEEGSSRILEVGFQLDPGLYRLLVSARTTETLIPSPANRTSPFALNAAAASAGGTVVLTGDGGTIMKVTGDEVVDLTGAAPTGTIPLVACSFYPGGPLSGQEGSALIGSESGRLLMLRPDDTIGFATGETVPPITGIEWSPGGQEAFITTGSGSSGRIYRYDGTLLLQVFSWPEDFNAVAWKEDGSEAIIVGDDLSVIRYVGGSFVSLGGIPSTVRSTVDLFAVAIGPDGSFVVVGESGTIVRFSTMANPNVFTVEDFSILVRNPPTLRAVLTMGSDPVIAGDRGAYYRIARNRVEALDPTPFGSPAPDLKALATPGGTEIVLAGAGGLVFHASLREHVGLKVTSGAATLALDSHVLLPPYGESYRWYRTPVWEIAGEALQEVRVEVLDPKWEDKIADVLVDRCLLQRAEDPRAPFTHPADPDSDGDGLDDGREARPLSFWHEAEDLVADTSRIHDDAGASNARNVSPAADGSLIDLDIPADFALPSGKYQVFLRARPGGRPDQTDAKVRVEVFLDGEASAALDEAIDVVTLNPYLNLPAGPIRLAQTTAGGVFNPEARNIYVWRVTEAFDVDDSSALEVRLSTQGTSGQSIVLDKLAIVRLGYQPISVTASRSTGHPGGEPDRIALDPLWTFGNGASTVTQYDVTLFTPRCLSDPLDPDTDMDGYRPDDGAVPGSKGPLTDGREANAGTNPLEIDTEGDLFPDDLDFNPLTADSEGDGLLDVIERPKTFTDWLVNDTDGDGILDGNEDTNYSGSYDGDQGETKAGDSDGDGLPDDGRDTDVDGLTDGKETGLSQPQAPLLDLRGAGAPPVPAFEADADPSSLTDPRRSDSDSDGIADGAEDVDLDGFQDSGETDASRFDTDGDGLGDGVETRTGKFVDASDTGTDPLDPDSDDDDLSDGAELEHKALPVPAPASKDTDGDGLLDGEEVKPGEDGCVTDPAKADTDGDQLSDSLEFHFTLDPRRTSDPNDQDSDDDGAKDKKEYDLQTDPRNPDSDGDGLEDGVETKTGKFVGAADTGTDPLASDSDGDGYSDGYEVKYAAQGADPTDKNKVPPLLKVGRIEIQFVDLGSWTTEPDGTIVTDDEANLGGDSKVDIRVTEELRVNLTTGELRGKRLEVDLDSSAGGDVLLFESFWSVKDGEGKVRAGIVTGTIPTIGIEILPGVLSIEALVQGTEVALDLGTGELSGQGKIKIQGAGAELRLEGSFRLKPSSGRLDLSGDIELEVPFVDDPLEFGSAFLAVHLADATIEGSVDLKLPGIPIPGSGIACEIELPSSGLLFDPKDLKFGFQIKSSAEVTCGPISFEIPGGPEAHVEIDIPNGYLLIDPICVGFEIGSDDEGDEGNGAGEGSSPDGRGAAATKIKVCLALEVSAQGSIEFEPEVSFSDADISGFLPDCASSTVSPSCAGCAGTQGACAHCPPCEAVELEASTCGVPTNLGGGHFRAGANVSVPVPDSPVELSVDGEAFLRFGDDPLVAFNASVGVGLGFFSLEAGEGTAYMVFKDPGDGIPRPSCIVAAASSLDWDKIFPGLGDLMSFSSVQWGKQYVKVDLEAGTFQSRCGFKVLGCDVKLALEGGRLETGVAGVGFQGCLKSPFDISEVPVQGTLQLDSEENLLLCLSGQTDLEILGIPLADARFRVSNHPPEEAGVCVIGRVCLAGLGDALVYGKLQQKDGTWQYKLTGDANIDLSALGLPKATGTVTIEPGSASVAGTVTLPGSIGQVAISGKYRSLNDFRLSGAATIDLGGFDADGTVTIDPTKISFSGSVECGASTVALSGTIDKSGHFSLDGTGRVATYGLTIDGSFSLDGTASGTLFEAKGSVAFANRTMADAIVVFDSSGALGGEGRITFAGSDFDACFCVNLTPSPSLSLTANMDLPDLSFTGVEVAGSVRLCAGVSGDCDPPGDFVCVAEGCGCASGETEIAAEFEGSAKVPGIDRKYFSACVSSSGAISFKIEALGFSKGFTVDVLD